MKLMLLMFLLNFCYFLLFCSSRFSQISINSGRPSRLFFLISATAAAAGKFSSSWRKQIKRK
jgi:hypothetical protein